MRVGRALALWLLLVGAAVAGPVEDRLGEARAAILSKDFKAAVKALDAAQAAAPTAESVLSSRNLAKIWYYRGVVEQLQGDKKGRAIEYWRQTLVLENSFPWDREVLPADDPETLFEALRSEVRSRDKVDVGAPEAVGAAKLYVDGAKVGAGDRVLSGQHLAQVSCPDGKTYGVWTDFSKPLKWLSLCPGGVDTSVVVDTAPQDEWSEFGPSFGAPVEGGSAMLDVPFGGPEPTPEPTPAPEPTPEPAAVVEKPKEEKPKEEKPKEEKAPEAVAEKPKEEKAPEAVAEKPKEEKPKEEKAREEKPKEEKAPEAVAEKPKEEKPKEEKAREEKPKEEKPKAEKPKEEAPIASTEPGQREGRGPGVFLMAGGGALLLGGAVTNFALVNPAYAEIIAAREDPLSVTRDEADALTARFDTLKVVTLGLLGGGVALTGVGVLLDSSVVPVVGPGQLGIRGSF